MELESRESEQDLVRDIQIRMNAFVEKYHRPETSMTLFHTVIRLVPALVLLTAAGYASNPLTRGLLALGSAVLWSSLVAATFHDCAHRTAARSSGMTRMLATVAAAPFALSLDWWRIEHVRLHHVWVGTSSDPDAQFYPLGRVLITDPHKPHYRYQAYYLFLVYPFIMFAMIFPSDLRHLYHGHVRSRVYFEPMSMRQLALSALWKYSPFLVFWALIWLQFGPYVTLQIFLVFGLSAGVVGALFIHVPHNTERSLSPLAADNNLAHNSDISPSGRIWTFIAGHTNHHIAHHLWPGVPHFRLPQVTDRVRAEVGASGRDYPEFQSVLGAVLSHHRYLSRLGSSCSSPSHIGVARDG